MEDNENGPSSLGMESAKTVRARDEANESDGRNQGSGDSVMSSPVCSSPKGKLQTRESEEKHAQRTGP